MRLIVTIIILAISVALGKLFDIRREHTAKIYLKSPPVLYLPVQNRFLSLPMDPSNVYTGSEAINVEVPTPIKLYIWELTGFYLAEQTGVHSFSIGETKFATIQLGWKNKVSRYFHDLLVEETHVFSNLPKPFTLVKGEYYPLKVTYIAGLHNVPISVEVNGIEVELTRQIQTLVSESASNTPIEKMGNRYKKTGFAYFVYLAPEGTHYEKMSKDYGDYNLVHTGYLDRSHVMVRPETIRAPYIMEIIGHIRPLMNGSYTVILGDMLKATIQVGPGYEDKNTQYYADENWKILDNRVDTYPGIFDLESRFYYPFRLVVLADKEQFRWSMLVNDPTGIEVDLFGLWERPPPSMVSKLDISDDYASVIESLDEDPESFPEYILEDEPQDLSLSFSERFTLTPQGYEDHSSMSSLLSSSEDYHETSPIDDSSWEYLKLHSPESSSSVGLHEILQLSLDSGRKIMPHKVVKSGEHDLENSPDIQRNISQKENSNFLHPELTENSHYKVINQVSNEEAIPGTSGSYHFKSKNLKPSSHQNPKKISLPLFPPVFNDSLQPLELNMSSQNKFLDVSMNALSSPVPQPVSETSFSNIDSLTKTLTFQNLNPQDIKVDRAIISLIQFLSNSPSSIYETLVPYNDESSEKGVSDTSEKEISDTSENDGNLVHQKQQVSLKPLEVNFLETFKGNSDFISSLKSELEVSPRTENLLKQNSPEKLLIPEDMILAHGSKNNPLPESHILKKYFVSEDVLPTKTSIQKKPVQTTLNNILDEKFQQIPRSERKKLEVIIPLKETKKTFETGNQNNQVLKTTSSNAGINSKRIPCFSFIFAILVLGFL